MGACPTAARSSLVSTKQNKCRVDQHPSRLGLRNPPQVETGQFMSLDSHDAFPPNRIVDLSPFTPVPQPTEIVGIYIFGLMPG